MPREGPKTPKWVRLSSLGMELAASVAGCSLIGYWIDRRTGSEPWGLVIGATLGFVGGMYNLLRIAIRAFREPDGPGGDGSGGAGGSR
jgi:F0F1-type ATP synthase assembly protein I